MVKWFLILIILLGLAARLYRIDSPIADWHSWRQADTSAVTRNFIKEEFNPFIPKYDDMSNVSSNGLANPAGYRFVEFPIYNILVYPFYLLFGVYPIFDRLVSVFASLGSIIFIYLITRKYTNALAGLLAALFFALLPFNVFFSRTTLPEPTFIFFALGMVYFVDRLILEYSSKTYGLALGFTIISFLIKPWAIFFLAPAIYSITRKEHSLNFFKRKYVFFFLIAITPFILWRLWILQAPEGIPASDWLLNGDGIRFKPAFWWWIVSERFGKEIFGAAGIVLFFLGLLIRPKLGNFFLHIWAMSSFLFMVIFATGNVRHNYYQTGFLPIAAIFLGIGTAKLIEGVNGFVPRIWTIMIAILFVPLTFYFTWKVNSEFYKINNPVIMEAGSVADRILPKDAKVVAPYNGDTAFLYQINRRGFPVVSLPIADLISIYGVSYYISTSMDSKTAWVLRYFPVVTQTSGYVIADLTKLNAPLIMEDPEP